MSRRRVKQNSTNIEHEMESSIETSFESPPNSSSSMTFSSSFVSSNPTPYSNSSPPKNCPGTTKALSGLILSTPATPRTLVRRLSQRSKENCSPSPGRYHSPRWQRKGKSQQILEFNFERYPINNGPLVAHREARHNMTHPESYIISYL